MTSKAHTPRNLTPERCASLQKQMLQACQNVVDEYGLIIADGGLLDMNSRTGFDFEVRVRIPLPDGSIFEPDKAMFEIMAESYGLQPNDFGRVFTTGRETFRIVGIEPRRPKYPIKVERLPDRRGFKFTSEDVVMYLLVSEQ